jgi:hypothetical protein
MKYIEELTNGDAFSYNNLFFLLTADFKKDNSKLCYNIVDGSCQWFSPTEIVESMQLFYIDKDNNIKPIKETPKITV